MGSVIDVALKERLIESAKLFSEHLGLEEDSIELNKTGYQCRVSFGSHLADGYIVELYVFNDNTIDCILVTSSDGDSIRSRDPQLYEQFLNHDAGFLTWVNIAVKELEKKVRDNYNSLLTSLESSARYFVKQHSLTENSIKTEIKNNIISVEFGDREKDGYGVRIELNSKGKVEKMVIIKSESEQVYHNIYRLYLSFLDKDSEFSDWINRALIRLKLKDKIEN